MQHKKEIKNETVHQSERSFHDANAINWKHPFEEKYHFSSIFFQNFEEYILNISLHVTGVLEGKKILNIGCGLGFEAAFLAQRGAVVLGCDISEESIKKAKLLIKNLGLEKKVSFISINLENLDFENEFDIIFCKSVLHHIPEIHTYFPKMCKFLKNGGKIIAIEPLDQNFIAKIGRKYFNETTPDEFQFKHGELNNMFIDASYYVTYDNHFFVFSPISSIFSKIFINKYLYDLSFRVLNKIDTILISKYTLFKKQAWIELICGYKRLD